MIEPNLFYVVKQNHDEGLDQLSIGLKTYEDAVEFLDCCSPYAFIVCTIKDKNEHSS
jgi:hypothetical protein|uniref:Uncharacterized protein n=1 Tax=uncultured marine virus TaxID=186617 RepID=A0A0F7L5I0_9VIRU|nr:hypothetical protein [uncultured marine virus]